MLFRMAPFADRQAVLQRILPNGCALMVLDVMDLKDHAICLSAPTATATSTIDGNYFCAELKPFRVPVLRPTLDFDSRCPDRVAVPKLFSYCHGYQSLSDWRWLHQSGFEVIQSAPLPPTDLVAYFSTGRCSIMSVVVDPRPVRTVSSPMEIILPPILGIIPDVPGDAFVGRMVTDDVVPVVALP